MTETVYVIDFETTGLSPQQGARAIEVAAVKVRNDQIESSYTSLINPGLQVPIDIQRLTGITESMRLSAPSPKKVFDELYRFIGSNPLVAHNASFDKKFLISEFGFLGLPVNNSFACTLKLARRVYPNASSHRLGSILTYADINVPPNLHRALADAIATAELWLQMRSDLLSKRTLNDTGHEAIKKFCGRKYEK